MVAHDRITRDVLLGADFPLPLDRPFTTTQASAAGISGKVLKRLVRQGFVRRMLRGVYVASQAPDGLVLRARALALVVARRAVVADWTAVWLFTGILPPGDHLKEPVVTFLRLAGYGRLRNPLCRSGERTFLPKDLMELEGLVVTTPLRTAWDVARFYPRDHAIGALDALLRHGTFTHDQLVGGVERFRRQRGVVQLRQLAPLADGDAESPGESVLRLRWVDREILPAPQLQIPILDDTGDVIFRLDLGVEALRFAAEYDGEEFHSSAQDRAHDHERRDWIRRNRGWIIEPVRKHQLYGESRNIDRILEEGIAKARATVGSRFGR